MMNDRIHFRMVRANQGGFPRVCATVTEEAVHSRAAGSFDVAMQCVVG